MGLIPYRACSTLRAGGNLLIDQNIVGHPTSLSTLLSTTAKNSWGITLVAGADLEQRRPLRSPYLWISERKQRKPVDRERNNGL